MRRTPPQYKYICPHSLAAQLPIHSQPSLHLVILEKVDVYIFTTVMESSPPSPRSYEFLTETLDILLFRDSQSDPDTLPSPSESHESLLEAVSNNIKSSIPFRGLEPQLFKTYRGFSSFLGRSREELLKLVSRPLSRPLFVLHDP
jgi:hypothetical protein